MSLDMETVGVAFGSVADPNDPNATMPAEAKRVDGFRYFLTSNGLPTGVVQAGWVYSVAANKWVWESKEGARGWIDIISGYLPDLMGISAPVNGVKIITKIAANTNVMSCIRLYFYGYWQDKNAELSLSFYNHSPWAPNSIIHPNVSSFGSLTPNVTLAIENGYVVIFVDLKILAMSIGISMLQTAVVTVANTTGWDIVDELVSPTATQVVQVPYRFPTPPAATAGTTIVPAYFDTATSQLVTPTGTTLPTAVLDNTLTTPPTNAPDGATFIVPATGATGLWAGKGNQKAVWNENSATYSFYVPVANEKALITTGTNVGNIYTYVTTPTAGWIFTEQPTGVPTFPWVLNSAYDAGALVIYNNRQFRANADIPINTPFVIGDTGTTWTALGDPVKSITADYTLLNNDAGYVITYSGSTPINITCSGLADKSIVTVEQLGAGTITFVAGSLTPRHVAGLTKTAGQYSRVFGRVSGTELILSGIAVAAILDIKQGLQNADHGGWVLLNGRAIASLTSTQQAVANTVFTGNLPDATGAYLAQGGTLGAVSGSNTKTIAQENIPNYALPTATTSSNSHSHTGTTSTDSHNHTYNHAINYVRAGTAGGSVPNDNANTTTSTDSHNHTFTTSTNAHTHTVSVNSGGSGTAFDITPKTLSVNTFVYLGL